MRAQLDRLERPRFRLSCREADWLGRNDQTRLQAVDPSGESPKQEIRVLRLDPLTPENVELVAAADVRVGDAAGFLQEAKEKGLYGLLTNPQNLTLLIERSEGGNDWPASRLRSLNPRATFATEQNHEHYHGDRARATAGEPPRSCGSGLRPATALGDARSRPLRARFGSCGDALGDRAPGPAR